MKRSYQSKKQQIKNERVYLMWFARLHDLCLTLFKWDGLPFADAVNREIQIYLNEILFRGQNAGLAYVEPGPGIHVPVIGAVTPSDRITWWGGSNEYSLLTKTDTFRVLREDLCICKNTPLSEPLSFVCEYTAELLFMAQQCMRLNLLHQNTPVIIQSPPGQELTYANMFEQIAGYKPVVYGREGLMGNEKDGIYAYRYLQPAVYVADKVEMLKHDILNDFFNLLGISAKTIEKRAQIISDELNSDFSANSLSKNLYMDCRQAFCDEAKARYGLDITCSYNVDALQKIMNDWKITTPGDYEPDQEGGGTDE